jgi:hypothetical protein
MPADAAKPKDELEPPGVATRTALIAAAGLLAFLAVALIVLAAYFHQMSPGPAPAAPRAFPQPQLETSIDPRVRPSVLPVAMPPPQPPASPLDKATLQRAVALTVARGAQAYDPPTSPPPSPQKAMTP